MKFYKLVFMLLINLNTFVTVNPRNFSILKENAAGYIYLVWLGNYFTRFLGYLVKFKYWKAKVTKKMITLNEVVVSKSSHFETNTDLLGCISPIRDRASCIRGCVRRTPNQVHIPVELALHMRIWCSGSSILHCQGTIRIGIRNLGCWLGSLKIINKLWLSFNERQQEATVFALN